MASQYVVFIWRLKKWLLVVKSVKYGVPMCSFILRLKKWLFGSQICQFIVARGPTWKKCIERFAPLEIKETKVSFLQEHQNIGKHSYLFAKPFLSIESCCMLCNDVAAAKFSIDEQNLCKNGD